MSKRQTWIIAYDIRDPSRLKRVYKLLSRLAFPLQYSVFVADLTAKDRERLATRLSKLIALSSDDVRFYPAPPGAEIELAGGGRLPQGVLVLGEGAARIAAKAGNRR
jgi:CRISPR-associated protein Cas2